MVTCGITSRRAWNASFKLCILILSRSLLSSLLRFLSLALSVFLFLLLPLDDDDVTEDDEDDFFCCLEFLGQLVWHPSSLAVLESLLELLSLPWELSSGWWGRLTVRFVAGRLHPWGYPELLLLRRLVGPVLGDGSAVMDSSCRLSGEYGSEGSTVGVRISWSTGGHVHSAVAIDCSGLSIADDSSLFLDLTIPFLETVFGQLHNLILCFCHRLLYVQGKLRCLIFFLCSRVIKVNGRNTIYEESYFFPHRVHQRR